MATKLADWASEHGQITGIGLSDGCGDETIRTAVKFGYSQSGLGGYLGNVGLLSWQEPNDMREISTR